MKDTALNFSFRVYSLIASLKPESPSTEAIRISFTPLFLISVITESQNFADSFSPIQIPSTYFNPSRSTPIAVWLDEKELMLLKDKISKTNFYRSGYIRKCSLGKNITVVPGIRDLIIEFKRIGSSLDKITRLVDCETSAILGDNLESIKEDLKTVWDKLADYFKVTLSNFFIF